MNNALFSSFTILLIGCNFFQGKGDSIQEITLDEIDQNLIQKHYPAGKFLITDTLKIGLKESHWCPPQGGFYFGNSNRVYVLLRTKSENSNRFSDTVFFKREFIGKSVSAILRFNSNQSPCEAYSCTCHSSIDVESLNFQSR